MRQCCDEGSSCLSSNAQTGWPAGCVAACQMVDLHVLRCTHQCSWPQNLLSCWLPARRMAWTFISWATATARPSAGVSMEKHCGACAGERPTCSLEHPRASCAEQPLLHPQPQKIQSACMAAWSCRFIFWCPAVTACQDLHCHCLPTLLLQMLMPLESILTTA